MTTSEPRTPHDDTPHEHRGLGKRIIDAVLGDPADTRRDDPDRTDRPTGEGAAGFAGDGPRAEGGVMGDPQRTAGGVMGDPQRTAGGVMGDSQPTEGGVMGDPRRTAGGVMGDPRRTAGGVMEGAEFSTGGGAPGVRHDTGATGYTDDPRRDAGQAGYADDARRAEYADDARRGTGGAGYAERGEAARDAGYDARDTTADARRDVGQGAYADRGDIGYDPVAPAAGRDPLAPDAPHNLEAAGYEDRRPADREAGYGAASATGATASGVADRSGAGQDFVTERYDPDRDTGYDPQAAGTAMDPADGPVARNTNRDVDDDARDTRYRDDRGRGGALDYDPGQDTGYVDAARAETDRTTGRRDDDYDTGRVDTGRTDADRQPVDRDRDDTHRGAGMAAAAAGAGAVAAAAFRGDRNDTDRDLGRDSNRDAGFSAADDTATVDSSDTGRSTPDTGLADGRGHAGVADEDGSDTRERLVPAERAQEYSSRWDALKGDFVDEPRRAVRQADELVGEVLDELQRLFADQRRGLEQSFDHDRASTEDLRLALRRYRSFFDRLLSF